MPLDYSDTAFSGELAPEALVTKPVADESGIVLQEGRAMAAGQVSKGFNAIAEGVATAVPFFKSVFEQQAADKKSGVLNAFQQEVLLIADGVDQGAISVPAARMRLRKLNSEYTANNPSLLEDLNNLQAKLTSTAGLADIVTTGNEEEQYNRKIIETAVTNGWQAPGETPEQAAEKYLAAKRSEEEFAALDRQLKTKQALRQEFTESDKFQATQALKGFVQNTFPWVTTQIDSAYALVEKGADPAIVIQQLRTDIGNEMAKMDFMRTVGGEIDTSYMTASVEKMVKNFEDWATGATDTATMKAKSDRIKAQHELTLRSDPTLGPLISASELIGNADPSLSMRISVESARLFGQNLTPYDPNSPTKPADVIGQEKDIDNYLIPLENMLENTAVNGGNEKTKSEVGTTITNLLRGVKAYSASTNDARDFKKIVEFFASPTVGKFAMENDGIIPANVKAEAAQVIDAQYSNVLLPLIQQKYEEAEIAVDITPPIVNGTIEIGAGGEQATSVIEPFWDGTGVTFRAALGYENNAQVQDAVKSLNSGNDSVAGPLNTLIRAKAHMAGTTDYKKVYEESLMERLWGAETEEGVASEIDIDELGGGFQSEEVASADRDSYFSAIAAQESGGNDSAKNPKSSATGRYQFIKGTWSQVVNSPQGKAAGLTIDGRLDPEQQEKAIRIFTEWNANTLERNNLEASNANLYAAHFLGADGAVTVLNSADNVMLADVVLPMTMKANPFLNGKTVGWFKKWTNGVVT